MHARRKPEEGLLNAFSGETMGTTKNKVNESKGGGALTRVVPIGLLYAGDSKTAFNAGVRAAAFPIRLLSLTMRQGRYRR